MALSVSVISLSLSLSDHIATAAGRHGLRTKYRSVISPTTYFRQSFSDALKNVSVRLVRRKDHRDFECVTRHPFGWTPPNFLFSCFDKENMAPQVYIHLVLFVDTTSNPSRTLGFNRRMTRYFEFIAIKSLTLDLQLH